MKGTNPIAKPELNTDGSTLLVHSRFYTIQGEGPCMGRPAWFIRLGGCNLRCWFCDTEFDNDLRTWHIADLVEDLPPAWIGRLIVLTGGEPMRQNIEPFVNRLLSEGHEVQIETAGTIHVPEVDYSHPNLTLVISPKTSAIAPELRPFAFWKYIIRTGDVVNTDTGIPISDTQQTGRPRELASPYDRSGGWKMGDSWPRERIYMQPCEEDSKHANQANLEYAAELAMRYGYRLSVQMHKYAHLP